jgi:anaerobic selenocysteine-containing dehydrogenase
MTEITNSFCRICLNACALKVSVENGRVTRVEGDRDNPLFEGYTCIKGRSQPAYLYHPERLLHSLKRMPDGHFEKIPVADAMDEIAERLQALVQRFGPRSIASYAGTMLFTSYTTSMPMLTALMDTIGSSMRFNTDTLDKGGKLVASSLHGEWMAPACGFDEPDVMLLIGINPVVTFTGLPTGNPGRWLKTQTERGMKLLVIDPRRTYVAKRAHLHLRPRPGLDVDILACFVRVILAEKLFDTAFVDENLSGIEELRRTVEPFAPSSVAQRTGLSVDDIVLAARTLAGKKRGYIMAGTGPHMAAQGTLTEYLVLALQSLCGYWLRAGDRVSAAPTLLPMRAYKAQASSSNGHWAVGEPMGDLGLRETKAGLPVTSLRDEMLVTDERRVRALITVGGNPIAAIPDTKKTVSALKALDLSVHVDPWMSASCELADYVIAPTMPLEVAATTKALDFLSGWTGYGLGESYAHYTPAIVEPPAGSDLIDDWKFLHGLATRLGLDSATLGQTGTTDDFIESMTANARVPLASVKKHPRGALFPEPRIVVAAKDADCNGRLDVGNSEMMRDLALHAEVGPASAPTDDAYPFRLICRRDMHVYNSSCNVTATNRGKSYNPAYLNPQDMRELNLSGNEVVTVRSAHGEVSAVVEADADLPQGCLSIMFGYGGGNDHNTDVRATGTNPNKLMNCEAVYDRYTGQPRMSNLPVVVIKN